MKPQNPCKVCLVQPMCKIPGKTYSLFQKPECMSYELFKIEQKIYNREINHPLITDDDKTWLSNGNYFREDLRLNNEIFVNFVFETEFKDKNFQHINLYEEALNCILANLVVCGKENTPLSKPKIQFSKFGYSWFKPSIINNILDVLVEKDYIIKWKGYYVNERNCRSARYYLKYNFLKTIFEVKLCPPNLFIQMNKIDPTDKRRISRSKKRKIYISPPPCKKLTKMTEDITYINNLLKTATIKFTYDNEIYKRQNYENQLENLVSCNYLTRNGNEFEINKNTLYLFRVFNRASYSCGGRFYTKIFQGIPSDVRPTVTIDGKDTVELDFSAHHLRILYHKEKIDFQDEIYIYNKADKLNSDKRMIHKKIAMIAINAETKKSAISAVRNSLKEEKESGKFNSKIPSKKEIEVLYDEFLCYHKPISKYVGADAGIYLQRIDSDIMNKILVELTSLKIIALPVHDSIIVQRENQEKLKELMTKYYKILLNYNPIIEEPISI